MQLGMLLPTLPREKLIVQTKVTPRAEAADFLRTFEQSLQYLRLDYVDLLSLHGINNRELLAWSLRPGGCLEAARQLQKEGRARHIGFSTHATPDVILDAIGTAEFDYVNLHWYFVQETGNGSFLFLRVTDIKHTYFHGVPHQLLYNIFKRHQRMIMLQFFFCIQLAE